MNCYICGKNIKINFNHFCRSCYHELKRKLGITNKDLRKYLKIGFGDCLYISDTFSFKQMYELVSEKHPTIYKLANILENILFLKIILNNYDLKSRLIIQ